MNKKGFIMNIDVIQRELEKKSDKVAITQNTVELKREEIQISILNAFSAVDFYLFRGLNAIYRMEPGL